MAIEVLNPFDEYHDLSGLPLDNGYIYVGVEGQNPETNPIAIFWDSTFTTPAANPVRTVSGYPSRNGSPARIYAASAFSITVKDSQSRLIYSSLTGSKALYSANIGTIAELRETKYLGQTIVTVTGYYTANDNIGARDYYWDSTSTEADNGGTIIQVAGVTTGRWKLKYSGAMNVKWFGYGLDGNVILYVSTVGSASNSGFTPDSPLTLQGAFDKIKSFGDFLYGTWTIQLASGVYTEYASLSSVMSENRILISGENVSGGIPTTIFDGTVNSTNSQSAITLFDKIYAKVKDIKFLNWTGFSGVGAADASICIHASNLCNVYFDNIHADNCGTAIYSTRSRIYQGGGIIQNCLNGTMSFASSVHTIGYGATTTYSGNTNAIYVRDASSGVVDGATISGNDYGVVVAYGSNTRISNAAFSNSTEWDVKLYAGGSCFFGDGNTHTLGRKYSGENSMSFNDSSEVYYDGETKRFNYGQISTPAYKWHFRKEIGVGVSPAASTFAIDDTSPTIGMGGSNTGIFGMYFSTLATQNVANILYTASDNNLRIKVNNVDSFRFHSTLFRPVIDNTVTLGASAYRWSVVYAATGTINTSDETLKTFYEISEAERLCAIELKGMMRKFKFNDAIDIKGEDGARIHFGVGAQSVRDVFQKYELDPFDYALLCYDSWDDEIDDDGNIVVSAGDRYGIRYDELLCFIISAM